MVAHNELPGQESTAEDIRKIQNWGYTKRTYSSISRTLPSPQSHWTFQSSKMHSHSKCYSCSDRNFLLMTQPFFNNRLITDRLFDHQSMSKFPKKNDGVIDQISFDLLQKISKYGSTMTMIPKMQKNTQRNFSFEMCSLKNITERIKVNTGVVFCTIDMLCTGMSVRE